MRPTVIIWIGITGLILFGTTVFFVSSLVNTTVWASMCNSAWENGAIMVIIPFAILGFTVALILMVFKGRANTGQWTGGGGE